MADIVEEAVRPREPDHYATLDAMRDGAFDDITLIVARFFEVPIAVVALLHSDRVQVKASYGDVSRIGCDLDLWLAATMASEGSAADQLTDYRVANDNSTGFHASAPLRSAHGHHFGTLSIIDTVPRSFSRTDQQMLARFGRLVIAQIEQRLASRGIADLVRGNGSAAAHPATVDVRTGLMNRGAIMSALQELYELADGTPRVATLLIDIDRLQTVNDIYGQPGGDAVLADVAGRIQAAVHARDRVGRMGSGEFLVILADSDRRLTASIAERVRQSVERTPIRYGNRDICITVSVGVYLASGRIDSEAAVKGANEALYAAKRAGRNRVVFNRYLADTVTANA